MKTRRFVLSLVVLGAIISPSPGHAGASAVAGIPAEHVGIHGPKTDYTSGPIELVGHTDLARPDPSDDVVKPLGNNGGLALIGDCAYVGRWHDYFGYPIQIVDIADPANPTVVGSVAGTEPTGSVAREIRAIDLPNFKMLTVMTFAYYTDQGASTPGFNSLHYYTFPSGDCRQPVKAGQYDLLSFRPHEFYQWLDPKHSVDGHPRILNFVTTPLNITDVVVVDASNPAEPKLAGGFNTGQVLASYRERTGNTGVGTYAHSVALSPDGTLAYMSQWDGGFYTVDTSMFAAGDMPAATAIPAGARSVPLLDPPLDFGNTHSAVKVPGKNVAVIGHEIYITTDGCPFGWMAIDSIGDETTPPSLLAEFKLAENKAENCSGIYPKSTNELGLKIDGTFSMHNQTVTPNYVLASWYGGGLRIVDISDPAHPVEAAFFVPEAADAAVSRPQTSAPPWGKNLATVDDDWHVATWSYPVLRRGGDGTTYIYVTDIQNGLYVLRASPGSDLAAEFNAISFAEGSSNLGAFLT